MSIRDLRLTSIMTASVGGWRCPLIYLPGGWIGIEQIP